MGGGKLEILRVEPKDGDAEICGDAASDARSDPPQRLEERALAERELQAERRVAPDQRAMARRDRAVDRATEHGRVSDRGDERHDERAHDERVGHGARHPGDDLVGDDAPHVPVVQRRGQPGRELLVVDECVIRVPRDRGPSEEDRGQDDHRERGRPSHPRTLNPWDRRMVASWPLRSASSTATCSGS
jgi:hypothetical protein